MVADPGHRSKEPQYRHSCTARLCWRSMVVWRFPLQLLRGEAPPTPCARQRPRRTGKGHHHRRANTDCFCLRGGVGLPAPTADPTGDQELQEKLNHLNLILDTHQSLTPALGSEDASPGLASVSDLHALRTSACALMSIRPEYAPLRRARDRIRAVRRPRVTPRRAEACAFARCRLRVVNEKSRVGGSRWANDLD
jgi:hypothetical protein